MPIDGLLFQEKIATYSSPTLINQKVASLFNISKTECPNYLECINYFNQIFNQYNLKIRVLRYSDKAVLCYLYNTTSLNKLLNNPKVKSFLDKYDYKYTEDEALNILSNRLMQYEFPHEIGIFLGYPISDVNEFIKNQKKCKLCGYYKAYSNIKNTKKKFELYDLYTKSITKYLDNGYSIDSLLMKFN